MLSRAASNIKFMGWISQLISIMPVIRDLGIKYIFGMSYFGIAVHFGSHFMWNQSETVKRM